MQRERNNNKIDNMTQKRINILSPVRKHVFYVARELAKQGYDVRFYTCMPKWKAYKYGMPRSACFSIFFLIAPFILLEHHFARTLFFFNLRQKVQDLIISFYARNCDALISISGEFEKTLIKHKKKGALIVVHRGAKHILEQKRILSEGETGVNSTESVKSIRREMQNYYIADYIVVQSQHVKESFLLHSIEEEKIRVLMTGVDLSHFYPISTIRHFDLIMVGCWSYQKGCDLIAGAVKQLNLKFIHVGKIGDVDFPEDNNFKHVDPVDQNTLVKFYNDSKIFILPSRQDGFGIVLSQALACNLPIIGSPDNGAPDLKRMVDDPDFITIIKDYTVDSVVVAIIKSLEKYKNLNGNRYAGNALQDLTWEAYGKRYASFLDSVL